METQKVDWFMMSNSKFFEGHSLPLIRERLEKLEDEKWPVMQTTQYKDPTIILIVSLLGGALGIDRFMIGDTGLGVAKLLTCGGLGIWQIVDWFLIMGAAREKNMEKFMQAVSS